MTLLDGAREKGGEAQTETDSKQTGTLGGL